MSIRLIWLDSIVFGSVLNCICFSTVISRVIYFEWWFFRLWTLFSLSLNICFIFLEFLTSKLLKFKLICICQLLWINFLSILSFINPFLYQPVFYQSFFLKKNFSSNFQIKLSISKTIDKWVVFKYPKWTEVAVEHRLRTTITTVESTIQPWIQLNWMCTVCIVNEILSHAQHQANLSAKAATDSHISPGNCKF